MVIDVNDLSKKQVKQVISKVNKHPWYPGYS